MSQALTDKRSDAREGCQPYDLTPPHRKRRIISFEGFEKKLLAVSEVMREAVEEVHRIFATDTGQPESRWVRSLDMVTLPPYLTEKETVRRVRLFAAQTKVLQPVFSEANDLVVQLEKAREGRSETPPNAIVNMFEKQFLNITSIYNALQMSFGFVHVIMQVFQQRVFRGETVRIHPEFNNMLQMRFRGEPLKRKIISRSPSTQVFRLFASDSVVGVQKQYDSRTSDLFLRELAMHLSVQDLPGIPKVMGAFSGSIIMEACKGDLWSELNRGELDPDTFWEDLKQLLLILIALGKMGIVHNDLKLENFLDSNGNGHRQVGLGDFDLAGFIGDQRIGGTLEYLPPEVMNYEGSSLIVMGGVNSIEAEAWSLGVVMFYVITNGEFPFSKGQMASKDSFSNQEMVDRWKQVFTQSGGLFERLGETAKKYFIVISRLLRVNPEERCSFDSLLAFMQNEEQLAREISTEIT